MKKIITFYCIFFISSMVLAQKNYTVNQEKLSLKTEVEGTLDLLWNTTNNTFRYFIKDKNENITELKNTKNPETKKYQEEYKTVLNTITNNASITNKVKLTLSSLKEYVETYNASLNADYKISEKAKLKTRIGAFGGVTNNPFVTNPDNKYAPFFGFEFEVFEANKMPRHAGFFSARHAFSQSEYKYAATQLALGYRYRFVNKPSFNVYGNLKFATLNFSKSGNNSATAFDIPFIFGLGADIKLNSNSFITFAYNELFGIFIDNQGNFPIDFAIGYKRNL
ncbi:MAG: hypothetical protein ACPG6B_01015 [Oceanihabitans sp.]